MVVVAAVAAPAAAGAGWSAPATLTGVPRTLHPVVTVGPGGAASAIVVTRARQPRVIEVARRNSHAARWRVLVPSARLPRLNQDALRLGMDARGGAVAAWVGGGRVWISERRSRFAAWSAPAAVSGMDRLGTGWRWSLHVAPDGAAAVAWSTRRAVRVSTRARGGAFSAPATAAQEPTQDVPAVVTTSDGAVLMAWGREGGLRTVRRAAADTAFASLPDVTTRGSASSPVLGVDGRGGARLVFGASDGGDDDVVWMHALAAGDPGWGDGLEVARTGGESESLRLHGATVTPAGHTAVLLTRVDMRATDGREAVHVAVAAPAAARATEYRLGFVETSEPAIVPAGGVAAVGWYEEPSFARGALDPVLRTRIALAGGSVPPPRTTRRIGGSPVRLLSLHGGPAGAAAVLRAGTRIQVATYRP